jgi:hypothetical protein
MRIEIADVPLEIQHTVRPIGKWHRGDTVYYQVETRLSHRKGWVARIWTWTIREGLIDANIESNPKVFKKIGLPYRRSDVVKSLGEDTAPKQMNRYRYQLKLGPRVVREVLRDILRVWREDCGQPVRRILSARATGARGKGRTPSRVEIKVRGG